MVAQAARRPTSHKFDRARPLLDGLDLRERRDASRTRLHVDRVGVSHEQQRAFGPTALERRDEIGAMGFEGELPRGRRTRSCLRTRHRPSQFHAGQHQGHGVHRVARFTLRKGRDALCVREHFPLMRSESPPTAAERSGRDRSRLNSLSRLRCRRQDSHILQRDDQAARAADEGDAVEHRVLNLQGQ
jgi:hypothetical protein